MYYSSASASELSVPLISRNPSDVSLSILFFFSLLFTGAHEGPPALCSCLFRCCPPMTMLDQSFKTSGLISQRAGSTCAQCGVGGNPMRRSRRMQHKTVADATSGASEDPVHHPENIFGFVHRQLSLAVFFRAPRFMRFPGRESPRFEDLNTT